MIRTTPHRLVINHATIPREQSIHHAQWSRMGCQAGRRIAGDDGTQRRSDPNGSGLFWRDFDYSAFYGLDYDGMKWVERGPKFHHRNISLMNDNPPSQTTGATTVTVQPRDSRICVTVIRLGHESGYAPIKGWSGRAIEYLSDPTAQPGVPGGDDDDDGDNNPAPMRNRLANSVSSAATTCSSAGSPRRKRLTRPLCIRATFPRQAEIRMPA